MFLKNDEWIWRLSIFFPCFEIGNWVCHILFLLHETYCERNNYSSLLWYVGPSIWTQFKKKVKVTKSQTHSIMSFLENIDWNQLVSIIFGLQYLLLESTCQKRQPLTKFLFSWCALCGACLPVPASLTSFWQLLSMGASYKEYALVQVFEEQFYSSLSRLDNIESILWKFATFNQCCYFLPDSFLNPFLSFQFKRPSRRYPILVWHFFFLYNFCLSCHFDILSKLVCSIMIWTLCLPNIPWKHDIFRQAV